MLDIIISHVQTWPVWGQAVFILAVGLFPGVFLCAIVAEVLDSIEVYRIRKQGRRWRKW
jgi:hypothetical protein